MSDMRQNPVTGRWVVVAPDRGDRPVEGGSEDDRAPEPGLPSRDPDCPFCPGNEQKLPGVLRELGGDGEGWRCRAVPNRYPAFAPSASSETAAHEPRALREEVAGPVPFGRSFPATGRQEVLIESDRHDRDPGRMSPEELALVMELYRDRLGSLVRESPELFPIVFRNHGADAGASLQHPHGQLVGTRVSGPARRIREERMQRHHAESGSCLLCELLDLEPAGEVRLIRESAHHRAYVPWAAEQPLEVWVVPKRHRPSFTDVDNDELTDLGATLGRILAGIRSLAGDPPYNYMVHSAAGARSEDPALHWFLQIRPITARAAGFEHGTGVHINPASPETDARRLRRSLESAEREQS